MHEDEFDDIIKADRAEEKLQDEAAMVLVAARMTILFEAVFQDFRGTLDIAANSAGGCCGGSAVGNVGYAIDMMDIGYHIREALGVPHPTS